MRILRPATLGVVIALGATGAYAQTVMRQIDNEPVETTVVRGPAGTVVTRRPLGPPAVVPPIASESVRVGTAAYLGETVGVAPAPHMIRRTHTVARMERTHRVTREMVQTRAALRHVVHTRTVARSMAVAPLVLAPPERRVIYRTIVQRQVIPSVAATAVPLPPPGYPPYPTPAYSPPATTGYAVAQPADDVYAEPVPAAAVPVRYAVGARLPADVALTPLPASAVAAVPAVQPYSYVTIDDRVLLVDPETDTVVADITP